MSTNTLKHTLTKNQRKKLKKKLKKAQQQQQEQEQPDEQQTAEDPPVNTTEHAQTEGQGGVVVVVTAVDDKDPASTGDGGDGKEVVQGLPLNNKKIARKVLNSGFVHQRMVWILSWTPLALPAQH